MKTFNQFRKDIDEAAALVTALPKIAGIATKVAPKLPKIAKFASGALKPIVSGALTGAGYLASKKSSEGRKGPFADTPSAEELRKAKLTGKIIKAKPNEKKNALKTLKDFLKARKIEGRTAMRLKQDDELATKGPGDLVPSARKQYLKQKLKDYAEKSGLQSKRDANKKIDDKLGK